MNNRIHFYLFPTRNFVLYQCPVALAEAKLFQLVLILLQRVKIVLSLLNIEGVPDHEVKDLSLTHTAFPLGQFLNFRSSFCFLLRRCLG